MFGLRQGGGREQGAGCGAQQGAKISEIGAQIWKIGAREVFF